MTIEELKQRLEGIRWIDKEISQLYLELQYLETGLIQTNNPNTVQSAD